jgi:hypothetical protein
MSPAKIWQSLNTREMTAISQKFVKVEVKSRLSLGMLAAIQFRIFCFPSLFCKPKN